MNKPKILVIDDEPIISRLFQAYLQEEGYDLRTASDFSSGLEAIGSENFDLLFVDISIGEHSGIDILREVKNRGLRCPVVMITGMPKIDTAAEAVRLGAYDYLAKPIQQNTVLRIAQKALQHKALLDENERYRRNLEAIFRSVQEAIITVDNHMRVVQANPAVKLICGLDPQALIGKEFNSFPTYCRKACHEVLQRTLKDKKFITEYRVECRHRDHPGQTAEMTTSPLQDHNNQYVGAVLVIRDLTRLIEMERELKGRYQFHNIIGQDPQMQEVFSLLETLADTETTVLITGESGTGKELVANALHYSGTRGDKPLIKVNCAALAENLLESELFGHVKGAFTGAVKDKVGRFQAAQGGTIFLDEIGEISPLVQLKLLRVLQEKEIERVGEVTTHKVDVRIITATNRDLKKQVRSGEFRQDLYYRLKVIEVALPPLRERFADIPLLVDHFRQLYNKSFHKNIGSISQEVQERFLLYPWPGNVRELQHALEHAFILCKGPIITLDHLPPEIKNYSNRKDSTLEKLTGDELQDLIAALTKTGWNKVKAARLLGISRQTIYRKISDYGLTSPDD